VPNRPHLQLISVTDGEEISNDALSIRGFQEYRCNDYHLGTVRCLFAWWLVKLQNYGPVFFMDIRWPIKLTSDQLWDLIRDHLNNRFSIAS